VVDREVNRRCHLSRIFDRFYLRQITPIAIGRSVLRCKAHHDYTAVVRIFSASGDGTTLSSLKRPPRNRPG